MTRLSDATLRRAAWAPSLLLAAMVVAGLVISFVEQPVASQPGVGWDDSSARSDAAFAGLIRPVRPGGGRLHARGSGHLPAG